MAPFRALRRRAVIQYSGYGGHKPLPFDRLGNMCVIARAKRLLALVATERKRSPQWTERERRHHVFSHDAHEFESIRLGKSDISENHIAALVV